MGSGQGTYVWGHRPRCEHGTHLYPIRPTWWTAPLDGHGHAVAAGPIRPTWWTHGRHGTCTSLAAPSSRLRHPWDDGRVTRWRVCPIWPCAHIVRSSHYPRSYRAISADTVPFPHESPSAYPPGVYAATFPQPSACAVRDDPPISPTFPSLQPNHNLSARPVSVDTPPFPSIPACHAPTGSLFFPHQPTATTARIARAPRKDRQSHGTGPIARKSDPRPAHHLINNRHPHVQKVDPHVNGLRRQRRIRPGQRASPADATDDADSPPTGLPGARA